MAPRCTKRTEALLSSRGARASLIVVVLLLGACSSSGSSGSDAAATTTSAPPTPATTRPSFQHPCGRVTRQPQPTYDHVVWIWMENHEFDQVLGSSDAPVETKLAQQCGTAIDYAVVGRPSLPNYIGATSGATFGIHDDGFPAQHPVSSDNLFRQVRDSGRVARSYEEAMPGPCALTSSGRYAVKHNPAAYYVGADDRRACARDDVPLGSTTGGPLADALGRGDLPAFTFITPDLCNDTHDCDVAVGDAWLRRWLGLILDSRTYSDGRTAVFVMWDEPTPMPLLVISPTTPAGERFSRRIDHYSMLRTTQELLGLPRLLGAAASSPSAREPFRL
jgi:hypothetical protein